MGMEKWERSQHWQSDGFYFALPAEQIRILRLSGGKTQFLCFTSQEGHQVEMFPQKENLVLVVCEAEAEESQVQGQCGLQSVQSETV